jgi:hypothetical protein
MKNFRLFSAQHCTLRLLVKRGVLGAPYGELVRIRLFNRENSFFSFAHKRSNNHSANSIGAV